MHRVKRVRYGGSIHLAKPPEEEEEKEDPLRLKQKKLKSFCSLVVVLWTRDGR